jgi:hypothetical protein
MFPLLRNRAARALDVAIEFATLGEYRLADPVAPVAPARGADRRAVPAEHPSGAPARPAARLVAPASAAALRLRPPAPVAPPVVSGPTRMRPQPSVPVAEGVAQLALDFDGTVPRPQVRSRGGAAAPAPQPCETARR